MKPRRPILPLLLAALWAGALPHGRAAGGEPELSADRPITYSAETGFLIAAGNAVYVDENTVVEADEIRYDRANGRIEASGNVRVTRAGLRLLARHVSYDARTRTLTATAFRAGYPPLFIEGETFSGTLDQLDFSRVSLYLREPVAEAPRLSVREGRWLVGQSVRGSGLRLKALGDFGLPLPSTTFRFGQPGIDVDARLGFRNNLGAYFQSFWLYPLGPEWSAGGNLDAYSKRGALLGPALRWRDPEGRVHAFLNTAWIHDHDSGARGEDLRGVRIGPDRGFAEGGFSARNAAATLQLQGRAAYLSDSEVLRDFRRDWYFQQFQPDAFADFTWQNGPFLLNVFARGRVNNSYGLVERLPEISAEWLPSELGRTGLFLQAGAAATRYRLQELVPGTLSVVFPDLPLGLPPLPVQGGALPAALQAAPFHHRLDGAVTLTRPWHGPAGIELVLRAGGRATAYHRERLGAQPSRSGERWVGELGLDLSHTLARTWIVDQPRWDLERLRHQSRLLLQYRWHPGADGGPDFLPAFDRLAYQSRPPVLDLADLRHLDGLQNWNLARFGWEHRLLAAAKDAPYREFLAFNLYQDLRFETEPGAAAWDALYLSTELVPFPWLRLQWTCKFRPEQQDTEATFLRIGLRSADLWSLDLRAEYLQGAIHQYVLDGRYRVSEHLGLLASWHYDARRDDWTEQRYGFTRRFGNAWQLECYVSLSENNDRDSRFSTGLRLRWLSF